MKYRRREKNNTKCVVFQLTSTRFLFFMLTVPQRHFLGVAPCLTWISNLGKQTLERGEGDFHEEFNLVNAEFSN